MTNLINQITIAGQTTTFLGYKNPVQNGGAYSFRQGLIDAFTQQFGNTNTRFLSSDLFYFKFPSSFESMPSSTITTGSGWRFAVGTGSGAIQIYANSNNSSGLTSVQLEGNSGNWTNSPGNRYLFIVVNNQSLAYSAFDDNALTSVFAWGYIGWAKNGQYSGSTSPRNAMSMNNSPGYSRVLQENLTSSRSLINGNPSLSCAISTPGANATDIIIRDNVSPNNYIGQAWNMVLLPSSAIVGKIYKNTGVDPDTGNIETDQKRFWVCVGSFGTDKIGMRVWTENII